MTTNDEPPNSYSGIETAPCGWTWDSEKRFLPSRHSRICAATFELLVLSSLLLCVLHVAFGLVR